MSDSGTGSTDRRQAHIETVEIESDVIRSDGDNYAIRINIEYDRLGDADIYYIGDIFFVDMRSGTVAKQTSIEHLEEWDNGMWSMGFVLDAPPELPTELIIHCDEASARVPVIRE